MKKAIEQDEKIEELKEILNELIKKKEDLLDSDIIEISRLLDEHLVEYHKLRVHDLNCTVAKTTTENMLGTT